MASNAAIDRAFELARSGHYRSVSEIIRRLAAEDRPAVEAHLAQPAARRELILICSDAWLAAADRDPSRGWQGGRSRLP